MFTHITFILLWFLLRYIWIFFDEQTLICLLSVLSMSENFKMNLFWKFLTTFSGQVLSHVSQSAEKRCIFVGSILKGFPEFCIKMTLEPPGLEPTTSWLWARRYNTSAIETYLSDCFNFFGVIFPFVRSHHWWLRKWYVDVWNHYWRLQRMLSNMSKLKKNGLETKLLLRLP